VKSQQPELPLGLGEAIEVGSEARTTRQEKQHARSGKPQ
jgi:hypothetical protein